MSAKPDADLEDWEQKRGQLLATQIAIRALILHLGDEADGVVQEELNRWYSSALQTGLSDKFVEGFEIAKTRLLPSDGDLQRYR